MQMLGSAAQVVFGILIAVAFMKLYGYFNPLVEDDDDFLQELAQYQVFFTLFIGLLLRDSKYIVLFVLLPALVCVSLTVSFPCIPYCTLIYSRLSSRVYVDDRLGRCAYVGQSVYKFRGNRTDHEHPQDSVRNG
jgi:hypothetical protein